MKQNEELAKKEVSIKELQAKITALQNEKINIEAEVKQKVDENDKIHNRNYKAFNEKNTKRLNKPEKMNKVNSANTVIE